MTFEFDPRALIPLFVTGLLAVGASAAREPRPEASEAELLAEAKELHQSFLTIDTHLDVPLVLRRPGFDISQRHSWSEHLSQVDFPRMAEGGLDGGFFVIFVGQGDRTAEGRAQAIENGLTTARNIHAVAEAYPEQCGIATTPEEAEALRAAGKRVIFIGIENGYAIGRDLDLLQRYYDLGARYLGVTHVANNDLGDSSTDEHGSEHYGLSDLGRAAVEECNRLGIMVDISHAADKTVYDILEVSEAPVIASHSGAYAEYPHPRNLNDALLREVARRGGVIQMNMFSAYMMDVPENPERAAAYEALFEKFGPFGEITDEQMEAFVAERAAIERDFPKTLSTVSSVVDHIDHMVDLLGIDHVGLSGDFDGGGGVEGAMSVADMHNITAEMLRRGYSAEELEKFWGGNVMRVLAECARIAQELQAAEAPDEDEEA